MTIQSYAIEVKLDATDEAHEAMLQIIKQTARDLLATSMLVSGGKTPQVIARTEDSFYSKDEIEILETSERAMEIAAEAGYGEEN